MCDGDGVKGPNPSGPELNGVAEAAAKSSLNFMPVAESQSVCSRVMTRGVSEAIGVDDPPVILAKEYSKMRGATREDASDAESSVSCSGGVGGRAQL